MPRVVAAGSEVLILVSCAVSMPRAFAYPAELRGLGWSARARYALAMSRSLRLCWALSVAVCSSSGCGTSIEATSEPSPPARVALGPPPAALVGEWGLSPRYAKHVDVGGFPILGSAAPSDYALLEAAYLVRQMIGHRPELLRALAERRVRGVVMATTELTTDVPEHADF